MVGKVVLVGVEGLLSPYDLYTTYVRASPPLVTRGVCFLPLESMVCTCMNRRVFRYEGVLIAMTQLEYWKFNNTG